MNGKKTNWKRRSLLYAVVLLIITGLMVVGYRLEINQTEKIENQILQNYLREGKYLIYGANRSAPPLRYVDQDGVYKGVVVDYMSQLSLELGVDIRAEPYKWENALRCLKDGETDFCDMFVNEDREKDYVFTDPIYNLRTVLAVRAESKYTFEDIGQMRIATEKGDYANGYVMEEFSSSELVFTESVGVGMDMLSAGEVDAVIGDEPIISYYIQDISEEFRMINTALYEEPVVLAMPQSHKAMVPVINKAIQRINNKGQLEKIQQKWFGISTPLIQIDNRYIKWVLFGGAAFMLLIGVVSFNNYTLKRQVQIRTVELELSRNELQLIFDSIPEYILILDEARNIVNANEGLLIQTGLTLDESVGKSFEVLLQKLNPEYQELVSLLQEQGQVRDKVQITIENAIFEIQIHRFIGVKKENQGTLITMRNITLDEINKKKLLQSSKMMAIGQLAAGMAHQIRNPLSIIRMHTYMLKEHPGLGETGFMSLQYIEDSVKKAARIIDNVMNFWRVSGKQSTRIELRQCFDDIITLHDNALKKKNITIRMECNEELWFISNDEALKHILVNLLSNGIDAVKEGGRILLKGRKEGEDVIIECCDNGCGIAERDIDSLFHPFYTTKMPGKGTGLGLFIVYSEVEKLKGRILVESKVNAGTTFTVVLPDKEEEANEAII
ncbi:MAG: transporter substrate-binding domain-containing protein [Lachnospiraceae bacterium]